MTDHTPMSRVSRLEVVLTGARRRWTLAEKHQIVAESYGGLRLVSVTAQRNGISTSWLFTWRRLAREGRLNAGDDVPAFVPVEITVTPASASTCAPQPSSLPAQHSMTGFIEIELDDCRVRVDRDVDVDALQRVFALLSRR